MAKRTKIVCTLGPAVDSESTLKGLIKAGMDVARFNFSHGSHEEHAARMDRLRKVCRELDSPCAFMLDTKGPEIRTGTLAGGEPVKLQAGKHIVLTEDEAEGTAERIHQSHKGLSSALSPGDPILIDDGLLELAVDRIEGGDILCTVQNTGMLGQRKSINVPGAPVDLPAMSEQDRSDLLFGIEQDVDYVAASFVRTADDVRSIRAFLKENGGEDIFIVSKIESADGVKNIQEIEAASDGIMVARGDLGIEVPTHKVPHIQKQIIKLCNAHHTPVITATQMLESMTSNPRPTRAEVADVANAIYDGTDAVMLSGETAMGKYPVPAVRMMAEIAEGTEPFLGLAKRDDVAYATDAERTSPAVGIAAVSTAQNIHAACIITPTTSGRTARLISTLRPAAPIYAVTQRTAVRRRMQLLWGVTPLLGEIENAPMRTVIDNARKAVIDVGGILPGELAVITAGDPQTAPRLPAESGRATVSAPTNVMYVVQIDDDTAGEAHHGR